MDTDLALTVGVLLLVLSVPSLLAAWVETRAPRLGMLMIIAAGALIVYALITRPGGYAYTEVPGIIVNTVAGFFN